MPTLADLSDRVTEMAADLDEVVSELAYGYIDEDDLLDPEFDFEDDELPIDGWQPSEEPRPEGGVAAKPEPEPVTPRPPWTPVHDARTVQRLQLLGRDVVRAMYTKLRQTDPNATLSTLFAQLEDPFAPIWNLDVANKRIDELMDSGRTADLAFELFPVLQLRINLLAAENLKSLRPPVTYDLNQGYDFDQGYDLNQDYPDEPPAPGFRPRAPKM